MNPADPVLFRGRTVEEVYQQITQSLGSDAVVVQLKRVSARGMTRIWGGTEIEALARAGTSRQPSPVPAAAPVIGGQVNPASILRSWGLAEATVRAAMASVPMSGGSADEGQGGIRAAAGLLSAWDSLSLLLPSHPRRVALVGPAGSGKSVTTAKWLTTEALRHRRACRVWRLDGATVNGAEALALHAELLRIPVESSWNPALPRVDMEFLDLPGWGASDLELSDRMANLIDRFEPDLLAVALNAAYDFGILRRIVDQFSRLQPRGLVLTHLDESPSPARVWDLVIQTGIPLAAVSSGSSVPGGFERPTGETWVQRLLESV